MNDTVVVFDRIRENLAVESDGSRFLTIVNRSINQTLSRTVLSSGLTFLTVLSLYLFGGAVLHGFSFALVDGDTDWYVLVDCRRGTHASCLPGLAGIEGSSWQRFLQVG